MSSSIMPQISFQDHPTHRPTEQQLKYLRERVYPCLQEALSQLADYLSKTEDIKWHQERIKRIKVFDKLDQKKLERDRLKADLGSEYVSSDEDSCGDFKDIGLDKDELQKILNANKKEKNKGKNDNKGLDSPDDNEDFSSEDFEVQRRKSQQFVDELSHMNSQASKDNLNLKNKENLRLIEEKDEENEKEDISEELNQLKNHLIHQREQFAFNPVSFLAQKLKEIHQRQNKEQIRKL